MDNSDTKNLDKSILTDAELVGLSLSDSADFVYLVERYQSRLSAYIKRLTNIGDDDLEDILQEIFIKVYLNLNEFDQKLKFASWIYRITHNQVISNHRKLKARPEGYKVVIDDALANTLADEIDIKGGIDRQILKENVSSILERMNQKNREVIILKFIEEKSYQEISDILKKPLGTVASLMNKAKKEFRVMAANCQNLKI